MKTTNSFNPRGGKIWTMAAVAVLLPFGRGSLCGGETDAIDVQAFLNSIGTGSAISTRGESLEKTIDCARYLGIRWLRAGIEGNVPIQQYIDLHKQTGVRFSWGLGSGGSNIPKLVETARPLARAGALLGFEGPNEPNNWGIHYQGEAGGRNQSWVPVAKLQRDLFQAVKNDPLLAQFPVWSISEGGAETDNVGLQFLTIPKDAGTVMLEGTKYADYANVHNYIYHPNASGLEDNKTWRAADPGPACKVDGLYGEYGLTWGHHYTGYSANDLASLPRVTTETGCTIGGAITEEIHGLNLLSMYLDQFKRGWSFTGVYLLRDRVDEAGNQKFGFFAPDYTPRKAAQYLHNLTTILADQGPAGKPGKLDYGIPDEPATVHDLLLQKSKGAFELVIWAENIKESSNISVKFGARRALVLVYDPTVGITPTQSLQDITSVPLTLSNHPVVLEIQGKTTKPAEQSP
jgi:hypothetical protein